VPQKDFDQFIKKKLDVQKHLYKAKPELLIVDINTDYLNESGGDLASLLTYNLWHAVNFATRLQNNTNMVSDNIFVDNSKRTLSSISPKINGLSNHNAQILTTKNMYPKIKKKNHYATFVTLHIYWYCSCLS